MKYRVPCVQQLLMRVHARVSACQGPVVVYTLEGMEGLLRVHRLEGIQGTLVKGDRKVATLECNLLALNTFMGS